FIVIPFQPDLREILKLPVLRDVLCRQMTVVINYRKTGSIRSIERLRCAGFKEKLIIDEMSHLRGSFGGFDLYVNLKDLNGILIKPKQLWTHASLKSSLRFWTQRR